MQPKDLGMNDKQIRQITKPVLRGFIAMLLLVVLGCQSWQWSEGLGGGGGKPIPVQPAPAGTVTFGSSGLGNDEPKGIVQTKDAGYLIWAVYDSFGPIGWMIKVDDKGNKIWDTKFEKVPTEVYNTSDNGFLSIFYKGKTDRVAVCLNKIDAAGKVLWEKELVEVVGKEYLGNTIFAASAISENGVMVVAFDSSLRKDGSMWGMGFDQNGVVIISKKQIDTTYRVEALNVLSIKDGYLIFGNYYFIKINKNGDVLDSRKSELYSPANSKLYELTAGQYLICTPGIGKIDSLGVIDWKYSSFTHLNLNSALPTLDGRFLAIGNNAYVPSNLVVFKENNNGDSLWTKSYGGSNNDDGLVMAPALNNCFMVVASSYSYGSGGADIWLLKFDENGNVVPLK